HLTLHAQILDDPRRHILRHLVRPVDAPELGYHQMGLDVVETPRTDRAQVMHADHAAADVRLQPTENAGEERRILLVEEAAGCVTHEPKPGPHQREGDDKGDHGVEPGYARQVDEAEAHHDTRA